MVIKHRSYYSMTDVQVEDLFRTKKYSAVLFGFLGILGFFKYCVRFAGHFRCQVTWQIMILRHLS